MHGAKHPSSYRVSGSRTYGIGKGDVAFDWALAGNTDAARMMASVRAAIVAGRGNGDERIEILLSRFFAPPECPREDIYPASLRGPRNT